MDKIKVLAAQIAALPGVEWVSQPDVQCQVCRSEDGGVLHGPVEPECTYPGEHHTFVAGTFTITIQPMRPPVIGAARFSTQEEIECMY